eukprot:4640778-Pleurochrysis_carterae.AAC.2
MRHCPARGARHLRSPDPTVLVCAHLHAHDPLNMHRRLSGYEAMNARTVLYCDTYTQLRIPNRSCNYLPIALRAQAPLAFSSQKTPHALCFAAKPSSGGVAVACVAGRVVADGSRASAARPRRHRSHAARDPSTKRRGPGYAASAGTRTAERAAMILCSSSGPGCHRVCRLTCAGAFAALFCVASSAAPAYMMSLCVRFCKRKTCMGQPCGYVRAYRRAPLEMRYE